MASKVQIDIPGIGLIPAENAATESTLQEILKALNGKGGGGGGAGGGGAGGTGGVGAAGTSAAKELGEFAKEIDETTTIFDDLGKMAGKVEKSMKGLLFGGISAVVGGTVEFGKALLGGSDRLGDLAANIPLIGKPLGMLGGILDQQIDSFRQASAQGASFGNNMFELSRVAHSAAMTTEQFTALLQENSNTMALFGSSASEGARRFATVSKGLRTGQIGENLMAMGFTVDTINEGFVDYSEEMARQGRLSGMSNAQLVAGAQNYLTEIDKLAKVTGLNRKELEASRQQNLQDARVRQMANRLEGDARENFLNNLALMDNQIPGLSGAMKDLMDGTAQTAEGQALLAMGGQDFADLAQQMATGAIDPIEFNNRLAELAPTLQANFANMSDAQMQALQETMPEIYAIASGAGDLARLTAKDRAEIEREQAARDAITERMGGFEQALTEFRTLIYDTFISSDLFQSITDMIAGLVPSGEQLNSAFDMMKPHLDNMIQGVQDFVNAFMADPAAALEDLGDKIMGWIGDGVKSLFSSFLPSLDTVLIGAVAGIATLIFAPVAAPFLAIGAALAAMFGWETIKDWVGAAWDGIVWVFESIAGIFDMSIGEIIQGAWDLLTWPITKISEFFGSLDIGAMIESAWNFITAPIQKVIDFFSLDFEIPSISAMFGGLVDAVKGFFSFDFSLPDFTDYLPKWLGGGGKSLSELFGFGGGDEPQVSANTSSSSSTPSVNTAATSVDPAEMGDAIAELQTANANTQQALADITTTLRQQTEMELDEKLDQLNTTMLVVAELLNNGNRINQRQFRAIEDNYNIG